MSMVGNQTNSQDPQAVSSRIFVGNLNTFQCTKGDVERIFQRYGRIAGISMHRGYAFVQFTNGFDAKSACQGEDGRTVLGQTLDVNSVTEPKPHQIGKKRTGCAKTANDWDYFYDSYYSSSFLLGLPTNPARVAAVLKRPRMVSPVTAVCLAKQPRCASPLSEAAIPSSEPFDLAQVVSQLKSYSNPDFLVCGNCRELFSEIGPLLEHKRNYCKMRFTCKCAPADASVGLECNGNDRSLVSESLVCSQCQLEYKQPWELLQHFQAAHSVKIYEIKAPAHEREPSSTNDRETSNGLNAAEENGEGTHSDDGAKNGLRRHDTESSDSEYSQSEIADREEGKTTSRLFELPHEIQGADDES